MTGPGAAQASLPPVLVIAAAASGRGKTAWLTALCRALAARGLRVGVVKHHPHPDPAGGAGPPRDTGRALTAGALATALAMPAGVLLEGLPPVDAEGELVRAVAHLQAAVPGLDLVLAEGFRQATGWPRLWVGPEAPPSGTSPCLWVDGSAAARPEAVERVLRWMTDLGLVSGPRSAGAGSDGPPRRP
jgi:molybdopterin-guanine dinucleotide biosynthesis protein MobB